VRPTGEDVRERLSHVWERIEKAARRAGRDAGEVTLVAVTKGVEVPRILEAIECGVQHIGENRYQEAREKIPLVGDRVTWHFVGHLQRNKVKYVVKNFSMIHSLDRPSLAEEMERRAARAGRVVRTLVEVNVSGEESKSGVAPGGLLELLRSVCRSEHVRVEGLMTIAPVVEDPEHARPYFRKLRELAESVASAGLPRVSMDHLSMGMTDDFEVAVEEGATIVRVGRAIFGERR